MSLTAKLQKSMHTWAAIMMISIFAVDMTPYRFYKRGDASASWDVGFEKSSSSSARERYERLAAIGRNRFVETNPESYSLEKILTNFPKSFSSAVTEIALSSSYGLVSLLSEIGEVREPGVPTTPKAQQPQEPQTMPPQYPPQPPTVGSLPGVPDSQYERPSAPPRSPDAPEAPREEPITPVEAPVPDNSDASIILIEPSERLAVEGLISELTVDVGRKTRGFVFPMPPKSCAESTDQPGMPFPDGELRIPEDAASFVIPAPGVQTVKLSHPLLINTNQPLVLVMEHVEGGRSRAQSRASAMQETCPLRVVKDSSTNDLVQRAFSKPTTADTEAIIGQIFGGQFDEHSGSYKVLTHRFSQPHTLVMHFLVKLGDLDLESLLFSTRTVLKNNEGYNLILPIANELGAKMDSEKVSERVAGADLPVDRAHMSNYPVDIPRRRSSVTMNRRI